ncbi:MULTISPECIES: hypothetical protein [unclassified Capnocytophaga]|jgi:hypothetical protein|uniref:hypothetical protein n=1 Tax=unclassified Capnocytophaga TaxID=2640652 RepID=UPI000202C01B|nr:MULTISPECIES: hypothetical protein [unclassified Capnocytophaga]EGD33990.1 membrane protein [Capnocytophaga sp. oral taxon 338 str. F0234]MEB3004331.1 hypothetical protein [Capnocytophaga sp. G2]
MHETKIVGLIAKIVALIFGIAGVVLCGWLMFSSNDVKNNIGNIPMRGMFFVTYLLLIFGLAAVILSATKNILSSPKSLKKILIYTGVFLGILVISYPLSYVLFGTDSTYQWISAGIMATYLLLLISLISVIYSVIKRT